MIDSMARVVSGVGSYAWALTFLELGPLMRNIKKS